MSADDEAKYEMDAPGMSVPLNGNPFQMQFDKLKLAPRMDQDEYVYPESDSEEQHDWGSSIFWGAGISFIGGSFIGGGWGAIEGFRQKQDPTAGKNMRINSILNACGRRGPLVGNRMGILAFMFTFTDGALIKIRSGDNDIGNKVAAGVITGAIFSSTSGPRQAAAAAAAGGVLAGVGLVAHRVLSAVGEQLYEPDYQ